MGWVVTENQRLNYAAMNQKALRADTYKNVKELTAEQFRDPDAVFGDDHQVPSVGRKILPSSHTGGPRYMNKQFQDAMAIAREHHKPDFFITMTCNPQWPEIKEELLQGQTPQDRPDLITRVFKLKKDQLLHDIIKGGLFGEVVAHMHVIEWQKRGLPHAHILIIMSDETQSTLPGAFPFGGYRKTKMYSRSSICALLAPHAQCYPGMLCPSQAFTELARHAQC